jgi:hypothetical protein
LIFLIFLKEDDTIQLSLLSEVDCEEQNQPLPGIGSVFLCLFAGIPYSLIIPYRGIYINNIARKTADLWAFLRLYQNKKQPCGCSCRIYHIHSHNRIFQARKPA